MQIYPYSSPIILTDNLFVMYGGQTGTTSAAQRGAAYLVAEKQASKYIGTFLLPTIITGTFPFQGLRRVSTDYGYVSRILSAVVLSQDNMFSCALHETNSCVFVWDDTFGYMDFGEIQGICGCAGPLSQYQYRLAYEAGLPTGVASQGDVVLALAIAASITLNEMVFPSANESAGDIGVTDFKSMDYSESRKELKRTAFGNSARANKAAQLLDAAVVKARRALVI